MAELVLIRQLHKLHQKEELLKLFQALEERKKPQSALLAASAQAHRKSVALRHNKGPAHLCNTRLELPLNLYRTPAKLKIELLAKRIAIN